jgi:hypothetical protein
MYQGKFTNDNTRRAKPAAPKSTAAPAETVKETPAPRRRSDDRRRREQQRKQRNGTILFYTVYTAFILAFFIALACVMDPLKDWLIEYEASQPNHKRDQVYAELFENPDWKKIYNLAGLESNTFENADTFAAYMSAKVGNQELTCLETSAGLSGDKKFIVRLGSEKIASFTLTTAAKVPENEIQSWELGNVEVFYTANKSVSVEKFPGCTVYINGVALDDSYTIRTVATVAENYLPEGVHGFRLEQQQVTGLLADPTVIVKDASGAEVPVTRNPETGVYEVTVTADAASTEEKELALNATKAYAEYMIGKSTLSNVLKHFDKNSQFYKTISRSEVAWVQSGASYAFTEAVYSDYYRYSDTLFSINVDMTLNQTRFDGSVKQYPLKNTMFFQKGSNGKWLVMEAANVAVQQQTEQVKLTFLNGDQVISSSFVDAESNTLTLPVVTAPEGKAFKGWVTESTDANGKTTLTMVFEAGENTIYLPDGYQLEPMTLIAHFEEVK